MQASVYVLECEEGAWYVGVSYHPFRRFLLHLNGDGSWYTLAYKPRRLAYVHWYPSRARAEYMEEVMTALLRDQVLKVGGGAYTVPSMSGRGRSRFEHAVAKWEIPDKLDVPTIPESFSGVPKRKARYMWKSSRWLVKRK